MPTYDLKATGAALLHRDEPTDVAAPLSLAAKLAEVMAAIHHIPKRGRNDFHKYDYATEADIVAAIRHELASRHVIMIPAITGMQRDPVGEKGSVLTTLMMTFTFIDGDNPTDQLSRPWLGAGTDKEDKGAYKAMTGGEKYFLLKTFLIPTGDDPEKDSPQPKGKPAAKPAHSDEDEAHPVHAEQDTVGPVDIGAQPLPAGAYLIRRVSPPMKNARGTHAFATIQTGEDYAIFDPQLQDEARLFCLNASPVSLDIKQGPRGKPYINKIAAWTPF